MPDPVVTALEALTAQVQRLNVYISNQEDKAKQSTAGEHTDRTFFGGSQAPGIPLGDLSGKEQLALYKQIYGEQRQGRNDAPPVGRVRAVRNALAEFAPQRPGPLENRPGGTLGPSASLPSQVGGKPMGQGSTGTSSTGPFLGQGGHEQSTAGRLSSTDALTLSVLGEHGGPAALRNMALESYGLQRSVGWAQNMAAKSSDWAANGAKIPGTQIGVPGVNSANMNAVSGALNLAANNPTAAYAAYKTVQMIGRGVGNINTHLNTMQTIGEQFGYGPGDGTNAFFGAKNPFNKFDTRTQVGAAFSAEKQALQGRTGQGSFGPGMTGAQAQSTLDVLGNQGFAMNPLHIGNLLNPNGDAATIAQNFFRPLMTQMPGLSAQDLGQFTPALRNSGTSVQQLTDTLTNLGYESRAAKETVSAFTASVAQAGSTFESMGSSPQGGYSVATGFTNATGLDPQIAGQMAQNPMFQGMMLGHGVLPSGIGDTNAGMFTSTMNDTLKMLGNATAGLATDKFHMVNGHKVIDQSGKQAQYDQMAQMTGLPANIVKQMMEGMPGNTARATAEGDLGQSGNNTGLYAILNNPSLKGGDKNKQAQSYWNDVISPSWKGTGVSEQEMKHLNSIKDINQRAKEYAGALANASGKEQSHQISNNPNQFTISLSGAAAKLFNISGGPSDNKKNAGAGLASITGIVNTPTGDLSAHRSSLLG